MVGQGELGKTIGDKKLMCWKRCGENQLEESIRQRVREGNEERWEQFSQKVMYKVARGQFGNTFCGSQCG